MLQKSKTGNAHDAKNVRDDRMVMSVMIKMLQSLAMAMTQKKYYRGEKLTMSVMITNTVR